MFEGPALQDNLWVDGFDCCAGAGLDNVPHGVLLMGDTIGPGFQLTQNAFNSGGIIVVDENMRATHTARPTVTDSAIFSNSFRGSFAGVGTRASKSLTQTTNATTTWPFDFCDVLIGSIATIRVSVVAGKGFPVAIARPPKEDGCSFVVETSVPMTGVVTCDVESSTNTGILV